MSSTLTLTTSRTHTAPAAEEGQRCEVQAAHLSAADKQKQWLPPLVMLLISPWLYLLYSILIYSFISCMLGGKRDLYAFGFCFLVSLISGRFSAGHRRLANATTSSDVALRLTSQAASPLSPEHHLKCKVFPMLAGEKTLFCVKRALFFFLQVDK